VISVGNQADNDVDLRDFSIESFIVVDIELPQSVHIEYDVVKLLTLMAVALGIPLANACAFSRVLQARRIVNLITS
jgi:hypothetical protein